MLQTFLLFKLLKNYLLFFSKRAARKFPCLLYLLLFSSVLFLKKLHLSFVLFIITLRQNLVHESQFRPTSHPM